MNLRKLILISALFLSSFAHAEFTCLQREQSLTSSCIYDNQACCQAFEGNECMSELAKLDSSAPLVQFKEHSLMLNLQQNQLCVRGLKFKYARGEKWSGLKGVSLHVSVENISSLQHMGYKSAEFMLTEETRDKVTKKPELDNILLCMPLGTDKRLSELRKDPNIYFWVRMTPLPPAMNLSPIDYPGNPNHLSEVDLLDLAVEHCLITNFARHKAPPLPNPTPSTLRSEKELQVENFSFYKQEMERPLDKQNLDWRSRFAEWALILLALILILGFVFKMYRLYLKHSRKFYKQHSPELEKLQTPSGFEKTSTSLGKSCNLEAKTEKPKPDTIVKVEVDEDSDVPSQDSISVLRPDNFHPGDYKTQSS